MSEQDRQNTNQAYNNLVREPLASLTRCSLEVNSLPSVDEGTPANLGFAFRDGVIFIDTSEYTAWNYVGGSADCAISRRMVVSPMRGHGLPVGRGATGRHRATGRVRANDAPDLWVTEMQTGCTVLILDWGQGRYSMTHVQPSQDNQFNAFGRGLMGLGYYTSRVTGEHFFKNMYKNTWLKQEATSIVTHTDGTPLYYIMVQSMFEASGGGITQLLGVKQGRSFQFYRQRARGNTLLAEQLRWSGWYSYLPYFTY